jgi:type I restriction enzyme S subunit
MKDSGIEWIGEIPEHWEVSKIKRIAKTNSGSTPKNILNNENSEIIWIRTTDINDDVVYDSSMHLTLEEFESASCPMLDRGTCVVAMYGGGGTIGKSGILGNRATINQALCSMEVVDYYNDKYLFYILKTVRYYWMKFAVGTRKDPNINQEIVKCLDVPFPNISEQQQIADYLDKKCAEIDELVAVKQQKIDSLKEYKKSLIYEYVTGKKEVI